MVNVTVNSKITATASKLSVTESALNSAKTFVKTSAPDAAKAMALFLMIVATLYFGREVLLPITLALLLAFILAPLVDFLKRMRLGRVPSVLLGVIFALGVIAAIGGVIGSQIADLTADLPRYTATMQAKISTVNDFTIGRLSKWADQLGPHNGKTPAGPDLPATQSPAAASQPVGSSGQPPADMSPFGLAERYLSPVLSPLATFGIVFVVTVFALLQRDDLRNRLIRLIGSDDIQRTTLAIDDGGRRLSRYFVTQLIINTIFGIVIGVGLLIIGVPNPVLWAVLSGLLRFVPYVGSFISAVFPLAMAAAVEPGWTMVLWTAALYGIVEPLTGQFIEPLVYGNSTGLSPFSVVVAAIFWSWIWGPVGLILSTPLTLCLVVIGRHVKRLEFLDVMLGDRPALTPAEIFYQRILAGDADEVQDQAELLLKDVSLSTYYDEVALKGLQRADRDARRGSLDREQLGQVKEAVDALLAGLEPHVDKQPVETKPEDKDEWQALEPGGQYVRHNPDPQSISPDTDDLSEVWRHRPAVLCIAGRGPLDEAVAAMLAQLLGKHGMYARVVPYHEVSHQRVAALDVSGVAIACVCYLDMAGSPAHMRHLVRRLRQRLPQEAPILVGLWPAEDPVLKDEKARGAIGADYFVGSLEQAVSSCAEAARKAGHKGVPRLSQ
ncbi:MAG: family transporter [Rhodospirillales bacterium]|nr:family transporter [Rhodospirillales bacterium]